MSELDFQPGDVVVLKSGGPQMTIEAIGKYGMTNSAVRAKCRWFDGTKQMEEFFELVVLKRTA